MTSDGGNILEALSGLCTLMRGSFQRGVGLAVGDIGSDLGLLKFNGSCGSTDGAAGGDGDWEFTDGGGANLIHDK